MAQKDKDTHLRRIRLLLVDDDASCRDLIKGYFDNHTPPGTKIDIAEAPDIGSMTEYLREHPYDLVMFDLSMSDQNDEAKIKKILPTLEHTSSKLALYSKHIVSTRALSNFRNKADVLCLGPDERQNVSLASKRAAMCIADEHLADDYWPAHERSQFWDSRPKQKPLKEFKLEWPTNQIFEKLCSELTARIEGFRPLENKAEFDEGIDLLIENKNDSDFWIQSLGSPIIAQCKTSLERPLTDNLYELAGRLALSSAKTAILFLSVPLPPSSTQAAARVVRGASAEGKFIIIVDWTSILSIARGEYPDTVFKRNYLSLLSGEIYVNPES